MSVRKIAWIGASIATIYLIGIIASGFGFNPLGIEWTFENSGQFGDSFGPLNTFMAAAALGAIAAYFAQKDELDYIKAEAETDRKLSNKRDFEGTFFNLVQLFRNTVNEIDVEDIYGTRTLAGREGLRVLLEQHIGGTRGTDSEDGLVYRDVYDKYKDDLAHYFRIFY